VRTDTTIPDNKPDIAMRGNEKGRYMLIYVAKSGDRNVIKKGDKVLKYKDITLQIQRLWNVKIRSDNGNNKGR